MELQHIANLPCSIILFRPSIQSRSSMEVDPSPFLHSRLVLLSLTSGAEDELSPAPATLQYWAPHQTINDTPCFLITTRTSLRSLRLIRGLQELGTTNLPQSSASLEVMTVIRELASTNSSTAVTVSSTSSPSEFSMSHVVATIKANLAGKPKSVARQDGRDTEAGLRVVLCALTVWVESDSPSALIPVGSQPTWRWSKPASPYLKSGLWEPEFHAVVEHGEWNAGNGFDLLLRGETARARNH